MMCQTSDVLMQSSEEQSQSYDTSSDMQRSAGLAKPKGMQIEAGDEGGTTQMAKLNMQPMPAQTARAAQRPSFNFAEHGDESPVVEDKRMDRAQMKKELTKSMTAAEMKK